MFEDSDSRSPFAERGRNGKYIVVYDYRDNITKKCLGTSGLDYNGFLRRLHEEFTIRSNEMFVLTTTDRTVLDYDKFAKLQNGSTLYLLQKRDQPLPEAAEEGIKFTPHYHTLIQSGMYQYYASQGQNPLPYALSELIDNSLSATVKNKGMRTIEIRLMFDTTLGRPAVIVLDNGCGMTPQDLKNWAVYRLSKFSRESSMYASNQGQYVRPDPVPRSLNSDISFFGVGGKQAAFYIGTSTKMISKSVTSPDVHELVLSKEDFERKEKANEDIYTGTIRNRKPGDSSHVEKTKELYLSDLIREEVGKKSFTAVIITGVQPEHIQHLKDNFKELTRRLAHMYHYYIHGVNGNVSSSSKNLKIPKIDIQITLREKPHKIPPVMNLREVEDDMQTLYIEAAADTFEFQVDVQPGGGKVEGILRYHPFLYDRETYPKEPSEEEASSDIDDDCDNESGVVGKARANRPIFECFWNGRLIPYTTINELDWCAWSKEANLPEECYSRFSGVLFTDDKFEVTTNKLTFTDLELKLKEKNIVFTSVGQTLKNRSIQKGFTQWLKLCHEKFDKQVKFLGYKETITRTDLTVKKNQHPWAIFSSIECDGKIYKAGQLVKSKSTLPIHYGKVIRFLLFGEHDKDVFATGGDVEIALEPKGLHDKNKIIPISKIDKSATNEAIRNSINSDSAKLPDRLQVDWQMGNAWSQKDVHPAGTSLGPLKIEVLNKKGETMSMIPKAGKADLTKLSVKLKLVHHGPKQEEVVSSRVAPYTPKWGYWIKKIDNLQKLGNYTLFLNAVINETNEVSYGGRPLPSYVLKFAIKAGSAESFVMDAVSAASLQLGVPFDIPLQIKDSFGHATVPPPNVQPVLKCGDLDLSYETVHSHETTFTIRNVKARGKLPSFQQLQTYDLKVTLPGLKKNPQTMRISLLPGPPHSLHVTPNDRPISVENGKPVKFNVEIHDEFGNITARPRHTVRCQVRGGPAVTLDCSSTGAGQLVTKPINVKIINGESQKLEVQLNIPNQKNIPSVVRELKVMPSTRVCVMEIYSQDNVDLVLRNNEKIEWQAGGLLENLFYKLFDEAGREVPLTTEIASMIKVNWTKDNNTDDVVPGKLPDVQVPKRVQEEHFYQVSYQDQSVSVSFTITPRPNEPVKLKPTLRQRTVKLGEVLSDINLELVDQYDNVIKTLASTCVDNITVKAEGLDKSAISFLWQESSHSVVVAGVCFQNGTPGPREICFSYMNYVGNVVVKLTAGDPAQIKLVSQPDQPLRVLNDHGIPTPFIVQLFDKWGNPSLDQRVVVQLTSSPRTLKVTADVTSRPVDAEGKASFSVTRVSGTKGYYQLMFEGSFNQKPIPGQSVNLAVLPDPSKPVSLSVQYDTSARFPAGGTFPVFSVTVVSDDGNPITTLNPAAITMLLCEEAPSGKKAPPTELKCSKPLPNERKDCFHFRDKEIPERAGRHTIAFVLLINKSTPLLYSKQISVNVVANQPFRLGPDSLIPSPVVSYSKDIAQRTLVENVTLRIFDAYGNPTGQDLSGMVVAYIKNSRGESDQILQFEGKKNRQCYKLEEGKIRISRLAVMEDSNGEDGGTYTLVFESNITILPAPLASFELAFHFYNDADNQKKMSELSKKKDELNTTVSTYKEFFKESSLLLEEFSKRYLNATKKVSDIRKVLDLKKCGLSQNTTMPEIDRFLKEKTLEATRTLASSRRVCNVPDHFRGQQGVLGAVGHLAYVEDDAAAWVISWHLRGDMDCVITKTTETAMRIDRDSRGLQQLMSLDSMFVWQGNRTLPHIRNGHVLFNPPGKPVHARDLLIFPNHKQECEIVFKNLLGLTILIDDLESGNNYRRAVVQHKISCPTILTRQGERISSNGKFGGKQNKAPPAHTLHMFGSPPPVHYYALKEQIELVSQYQLALKKSEEAGKERQEHMSMMSSPATLAKRKQMQEKETELRTIERQLASTPVRPGKRGPQDAGEPSGISTKRTRQRPT